MADRRSKASGRGGGGRDGGGGGRQRGKAAGGAPDSLYERYKEALRRGHVAALRGRLEASIEAYSEAATIAADRALPHTAIGGVLVRMSRLPDALAAYDRALTIAPRDETALRGRADALDGLGRRVPAAEALDRLAAVLDGAGRLADAADTARHALELAESRERRRSVEAFAARLRASTGDEAAARALARVLHVLEPRVAPPEAISEPGDASTTEAAADATAAPEPEPEPEPELPDGIAIGGAAEEALHDGDIDAAREGLLAAARAHRRVGRSNAAIDACYLALAVAPADIDLHLLLAELYIERGWRGPAVDKLVLLGRLATLAADGETRDRLCALAAERLPGEPRLADLCA